MMAGCPHDDIRDCPLYHAAHVPDAGGCVYGDWHEGCAVARGELDYAAAVARVRVNHPAIVAECEWMTAKRNRQEQRQRNMRAAGVH